MAIPRTRADPVRCRSRPVSQPKFCRSWSSPIQNLPKPANQSATSYDSGDSTQHIWPKPRFREVEARSRPNPTHSTLRTLHNTPRQTEQQLTGHVQRLGKERKTAYRTGLRLGQWRQCGLQSRVPPHQSPESSMFDSSGISPVEPMWRKRIWQVVLFHLSDAEHCVYSLARRQHMSYNHCSVRRVARLIVRSMLWVGSSGSCCATVCPGQSWSRVAQIAQWMRRHRTDAWKSDGLTALADSPGLRRLMDRGAAKVEPARFTTTW